MSDAGTGFLMNPTFKSRAETVSMLGGATAKSGPGAFGPMMKLRVSSEISLTVSARLAPACSCLQEPLDLRTVLREALVRCEEAIVGQWKAVIGCDEDFDRNVHPLENEPLIRCVAEFGINSLLQQRRQIEAGDHDLDVAPVKAVRL